MKTLAVATSLDFGSVSLNTTTAARVGTISNDQCCFQTDVKGQQSRAREHHCDSGAISSVALAGAAR